MTNFFRSAAIGLAVLILLLGLHYIGWLQPAENLTARLTAPTQRFFLGFSLKVKSFYGSWLSRQNLIETNRALTERLRNQQINESRLKSLAAENLLLKKELSFAEKNTLTYVAAKIITGVSHPHSFSVIIDRGRNDGLDSGLAVIAEGGVLIGKITEISNDFSKVLLLTDNRSRVAATVQNLDRTAGLVEGQFGLSMIMTDIPQDEKIAEGDSVVTSGLEGKVPRGLLIAEVESVNQVESEIFKTAVLKPIIPFDSLSYVLVVKP